MKSKSGITIEAKHGQYYARWRSAELVKNKHGEEVPKQYFEPTYVPLPGPDATKEEIAAKEEFAFSVAAYKASLTGKTPPSAALQTLKLREFALKTAETNEDPDSIKMFIPLFMIDYAYTEKEGSTPKLGAVKNMVTTWNRILEALGPDRTKHPSVIPATTLQKIVDKLAGKQERHVVNLRCAYKYGVSKGYVLKGENPAADVVVHKAAKTPRIAFEQADLQRGLAYMHNIPDGDQWQLVTLAGIYTPMRFLTACRLRLIPTGFVRPERPRTCAVLDTKRWHIEYFDTKSEKWEIQILDVKFINWLKPYLKKNKFAPGDFLFPALARKQAAPSERWQQIMERSGCTMQYSKSGFCRTGFHALRISRDKWVKENEEVLLSRDDIETKLQRHGSGVHQGSYDSGAPNVLEQRRINKSLPTFLPGDSDLNGLLLEVGQQKRELLIELQSLDQQEQELIERIQKESHDNKTN